MQAVMSTLLLTTDWTLFIGRFHPILVHFPIGFLLLGLLLHWARNAGKVDLSENVLTFIYFVSAIGATIACIAGYLLAWNGGYDDELLSSHMWRGIGVALFAWLLWSISARMLERWLPKSTIIQTPLMWLTVLLVFSTGHLGGALTYGEDYLFQYAPEPLKSWFGSENVTTLETEIKPLDDVSKAVIYRDIVQPILSTKCVQCHSAQKSKGDLRLDSYAHVMKGGESGAVVRVGKGKESALIKSALLPLSDDGHMPPKGKPQLTEEQILLLTWWIDHGAEESKLVAEYPTTDQAVQQALQALGSGAVIISQGQVNKPSYVEEFKPNPAAEVIIENLRKNGLIVNPLADKLNSLEISAINNADFSDRQTDELLKAKDQITWLKLSRTKITDETLNKLGQLTHLTKLNLEYNSALSATALKSLATLPHLEYLNVIGTGLDDEALETISNAPSLRQIYVWQTKVTPAAIAAIKAKKPHLEILSGMSEEEVKSFLEISKKETEKK